MSDAPPPEDDEVIQAVADCFDMTNYEAIRLLMRINYSDALSRDQGIEPS